MGRVTQREGIIYRKTGDRDVIREKLGAGREPLGPFFFFFLWMKGAYFSEEHYYIQIPI